MLIVRHDCAAGARAGWRRLTGLVVLLAALALLPGSGTAHAARAAGSGSDLFTGINHVIVIYEENHSFDNMYGLFPGANGIVGATDAQKTQTDKQGRPYTTLPAPLAAPVDGKRNPDPRFPADLPNGPYLMNQYVAPADKTGDMIHAFYREQYQIDGGKMDKFAAWSDGAGLAMGYWDASGLPLYELAKQYTVADNFFHAAFGGSFLNHFWLVCACTPVWPGAPADTISIPFPGDPDHLQDKNVTPDGYAVNTTFSVNSPHPASTAADHLLPNQTMPNIGDRLSAAGVSWAWYAGGWNDALAGHADPLYQFHHQPFNYFANYADGTAAKAQHLKDETDFETALRDGTLPAVSFVKPLGPDNEHPGYANISQGEDHAVKLISEVHQSRFWQDTAIIVTYDEHGGSWDHVAPPVVDRWGPGLRVPAIIISPYAKKGFVDHTQYDTTSILALIEARWHLQPLGTRDAGANNLLSAFDFSQSPGSAGSVPGQATLAGTFSFGLWGDMPYARSGDGPKIEPLIANMNAAGLAFSVFDGDIKDGSSRCDDSQYIAAVERFNSFDAPMIYVPGDNEWTDCHRLNNGGYSNLERLDYIRRTMFSSANSFGRHPMPLEHQGPPVGLYAENTRWTFRDVVFVGLNVPGSNNNKVSSEQECMNASARTQADCDADNAEYQARDAANIDWLRQSFTMARSRGAAGIMLIIQADPGFDLPETETVNERESAAFDGYTNFLAALVEETRGFAGQVVLVHGDTHFFKVDKPLLDQAHLLQNFTRLETFGSPNVHWVRVDVDPRSRTVFTFTPMLVSGN